MTNLPLTIHAGDERPIYRQITQQVVAAIAGGRLSAGAKLPSHRELAALASAAFAALTQTGSSASISVSLKRSQVRL